MAENAGMFPVEDVIEKVKNSDKNMGYNFVTKEFVDLMENGIIDSAKNTRLALEASVSTAKSLIKGETVIIEEEIKDDKCSTQS